MTAAYRPPGLAARRGVLGQPVWIGPAVRDLAYPQAVHIAVDIQWINDGLGG
jgi:hypothetical protein